MEFYINNEKIDISLDSEKTVGDVFTSFEKLCEENSAAVIKIKLNEKIVNESNFDEISKNLLDKNDKFEFTIVTKEDIKASYKNLSENFKTIEENLKQIPLNLQCGKLKESYLTIKNLADCIDEFCHVSTISTLFPEISITKINETKISEFFKDFTPILKDFETALKENDTVTVGDLSEYELSPRLIDISNSLEDLICQ